MRLSGKRVAAAATAVIVVVVAARYLATLLASVAFLIDVAQVAPAWRTWLPVSVPEVTATDIQLPTRYGDIEARVHRPSTGAAGTVVVFPGVHTGGVDEPRLSRLCGRLAATGLTVICAPLPELRAFRITSRSTDAIEDATRAVTERADLTPSGRVGLIGVSFAGGLAVVAAGRPSLHGRLTAVVSLGGHGDLPRVLRYLATGDLPGGGRRQPHDYAVAVLAYGAVDRLVPARETAGLSAGIRAFLEASASDGSGMTSDAVARLVREPVGLDEPAATILREVFARDTRAVGARLLPFVEQLGGASALSPERSPGPTAPVFLLHGLDDAVIPSTETLMLARHLEATGVSRVRWLRTPLVSHAHLAGTPSGGALWRLTLFWRRLLATFRSP